MKSPFNLTLLLLAMGGVCYAERYRVLMVPMAMKSQLIIYARLAEELVNNGFFITLCIPDSMSSPFDKENPNIHVEKYHMRKVPLAQDTTIDGFPEFYKTYSKQKTSLDAFLYALKVMPKYEQLQNEEFEDMFKDTLFMKRIMSQEFDVAIVYDVPGMTALPYKLSLPAIYQGTKCQSYASGSLDFKAQVPFFWTAIRSSSALRDRMMNTFLYTMDILMYQFPNYDLVQKYVKEKPLKSYQELRREGLLCLEDTAFSVDHPRPRTPNIIPLGKLVAVPAEKLQSDLESFVSNSKHGVIIVVFGSHLNPQLDQIMKMLQTFSSLKENVILKLPSKPNVEIPSHVRIMKWLPLNDLLGHPKTKLLISHGGTSSLLQAVYHSVPSVMFPHAYDQYQNAGIAENKGYGVQLDINSFTTEEFIDAIHQVLNNHSYAESVKRESDILHNSKDISIANIVFWIKHVIRYGNKHLLPPTYNMPLYQYFMLDIISVCILIFAGIVCMFMLIIWLIKSVCKKIYKVLFQSKEKVN